MEERTARGPSRKRPDVALRKEAGRTLSNDVVTCTWKSLARGAGKALDIEDALSKVNQVALEAYELAQSHVLRLLREGKSVPNLDQSFWYRCCCAVTRSSVSSTEESSDGPHKLANDAELDASAVVFALWRQASLGCSAVDGRHMRPFWQTLSQQMATNVGNMMTSVFGRRFKAYVKRMLDCSGAFAYKVASGACDFTGTFSTDANSPEAVRFRRLLPLPPSDSNLSKQANLFMPLLWQMQRANNADPTAKHHHSLLPHKGGFTTQFIKINTNTLRALIVLSAANVVEDVEGIVPPEPEFLELKDMWWDVFTNVACFEEAGAAPKRRRFGYEVLTDGRSAKVVMSKPAVVPEERVVLKLRTLKRDGGSVAIKLTTLPALPTLRRPDDYDVIWGIDPGQRHLINASRHAPGVDAAKAKLENFSVSAKEFYHRAKYTRSSHKCAKWQREDAGVKAYLDAKRSKHHVSANGVMTYMQSLWPVLPRLLAFFGARRFRNLKLLRHIARKKELVRICKRLAAGAKDKRRALVGLGDFSITSNSCIKGHPPGPIKAFRKELCKHVTVLDVDEDFTSQICSSCFQRSLRNMRSVKHVRAGNGAVPPRWRLPPLPGEEEPETAYKRRLTHKIHGVLHCSTSVCHGMTWDRDVNSSRNHLVLTLAAASGMPRPACFCRTTWSCTSPSDLLDGGG